MLTFCTLFDSNYLDKGLVLYESMEKVMSEYKLYVLAMDEKCNAILRTMKLPHMVVISNSSLSSNSSVEITTI